MITVIQLPNSYKIDNSFWWFIYDQNTLELVCSPQKCSGYINSQFTLVISDSDSPDELQEYISYNDITDPNSDIE